jgi:hypothetical protein
MLLRYSFFKFSRHLSPSSLNRNIRRPGYHRSLFMPVSLKRIPEIQIGVDSPVTLQNSYSPQSHKWLEAKLTPSWDACMSIWHDIQQLDMAQNYSKSIDIDTLHASAENLDALIIKLQRAITKLKNQITVLQQTSPDDRLQIHELVRLWQTKLTLAHHLRDYWQRYATLVEHDSTTAHNQEVVYRFMYPTLETTQKPTGNAVSFSSALPPILRRKPLPAAVTLTDYLPRLINSEDVVDVRQHSSP